MSTILKRALIALPIIGAIILLLVVWMSLDGGTAGRLFATVLILFVLLWVIQGILDKVDIPNKAAMSFNFKSAMILLVTCGAFIGIVDIWDGGSASEIIWKLYTSIAILFVLLLILYAILLNMIKKDLSSNRVDEILSKSIESTDFSLSNTDEIIREQDISDKNILS